MKLGRLFPLLCFGFCVFFCSANALGALTVILTRHAEKAVSTSADPPLSPAGQKRAATLAAVLADSQVSTIYVTEFRRTQQTAQPTADRLHIRPVKVMSAETDSLVAKLRAVEQGTVLVIGHSNTVPALILRLGGPRVAIPEQEFDDLFVLTITHNQTSYLKLHYGQMSQGVTAQNKKEPKMELSFVRSGGLAGAMTQVEGKVIVSSGGTEVTSDAVGYKRTLKAEETTMLESAVKASTNQTASPDAQLVRDGYQYEIRVTDNDGKTRELTRQGESSSRNGDSLLDWVSKECSKIWEFRISK